MLQLKCAACGFVSDVDMRDKLTTFILKNPPEAKKGSKDKKAMRRAEKERLKEGQAADEEQKKLKKEAKKKGPAKDASTKPNSKKKSSSSDEDRSSPPRNYINKKDEEDDDDDDDIQWQTDTSMEAAHQRIKEQLNAVTADMVMLSTDDTEKKSKTANKTQGSPKALSPPRETNSKVENVNSSHVWLVKEMKDNLQKGITASEFRTVLGSLSGTQQEIMTALYEALLDGVGKGFAKVVIKKRSYVAAAISLHEGSQLHLLRAIEEFCSKSNPAAVKEVALVLKALYDTDLLDEEYIMKWYSDGLKGVNKDAPIWKNTKPFVEWLQSAESETEEE